MVGSPRKLTRRQYDFIVNWHLERQASLHWFGRVLDECWDEMDECSRNGVARLIRFSSAPVPSDRFPGKPA